MTCLVGICVLSFLLAFNVEGKLEDKIAKYFKSETQKNFLDEWQKQKKPFQSAVRLMLQGLMGDKNMNVYMQKVPSTMIIAKGYFFTDNVISVLLSRLFVRALPRIVLPDVTFALSHNALRVEGPVGKIFIEADYTLFRNKSAIMYPGVQDPYKNSPFTFQQVQSNGQLAIIAVGCSLVGTTVTTLIGSTVNLGHSSLKLTNCKFSIEIYKDGAGMPPVIAPYFSKQQRLQLEGLLSRAIMSDTIPKLQAVMFSFVNTSAIFGRNLLTYRHEQDKIFKQTSDYMTRVVRALNKLTANKNQGNVPLDNLILDCDDAQQETVKLTNLSLSGLDSAYCPHTGGPYVLTSINIAEEIRFNALQVRGDINASNGYYLRGFRAEIRDVAVSLKINVDMTLNEKKTPKNSKDVRRFQLVGWGANSFSLSEEGRDERRDKMQAIVSAWLINEVPKAMVNHISSLLSEALSNPEKGHDQDAGDNNALNNDGAHKANTDSEDNGD